jgi:hypothetical protein
VIEQGEGTRLISLAQAATLVGCKDTRTAQKRIIALGVGMVEFSGRRYVIEAALRRAILEAARPERATSPGRAKIVATASRSARLWDGLHPQLLERAGVRRRPPATPSTR